MSKQKSPPIFGTPPITKAWLLEQFDSLHEEHLLILSKLGEGNVTPELAAALLKCAGLSTAIDEQVPDKQVPPGSISNPPKPTIRKL